MAPGLEEMKDTVRPAHDRIGTHRATKENTSLRLSWTTIAFVLFHVSEGMICERCLD